MNKGDQERLTEALRVWLEHHPDPDHVCVQLAEGAELTPRQLVDQVTEPTEVGQLFLRVFDSATERVPLDAIIEDLTRERPGEPRRPGR